MYNYICYYVRYYVIYVGRTFLICTVICTKTKAFNHFVFICVCHIVVYQ